MQPDKFFLFAIENNWATFFRLRYQRTVETTLHSTLDRLSKRIRKFVMMNRCGKNCSFSLLGTFAFLGLAVCVFAWGMQYKLSLYETNHSSTHAIPSAKLLSSNEQSRTTKSLLVVRIKNSPTVKCALTDCISGILLPASRPFNPPTGQSAHIAICARHLHINAYLSDHFVRPPPVLG